MIAGTFTNMLLGVADLFTEGLLSGNAANMWWIGGWAADIHARGAAAITEPVRFMSIPDFLSRLGRPDALGLALLLGFASWAAVGVVVAWAMTRMRGAERLTDFAALAAFTVHAYFVLATQVHENHLFLALPLLTMIAARERRYRPLLVAVSAVAFLNLNFFYGLGRGGAHALPRMATGIDATLILAAVNCVLLVWHARLMTRVSAVRPATLDMLRAHLRAARA